ncbi:hypothetical protein Trco_002075 [Trichoderma cornu-damae]|uniref:DH domain-containing protein n=1 Tax=Trichoderma cornu-damae TaxID=654480 RepID=A0A9P8QP58_9HYPO|nr:hypothetical protein Trco_002075 [Trichoderma cornu-damae]
MDPDLDGHDAHPPARHLASSDTNAKALARHAAAALDPDDFYKSSQAAPGPNGELQPLPMASPVPPRLPSSADGAAARHLQPPANRGAGRQGMRSASSPLDRGPAAASRSSPASAPSVKDLKKRFDQSGGANSIPRGPPRQHVPVARIRQDSIKPKPKPPGPSSAHAGLRPGIPAANSSRQSSSSSSSSSLSSPSPASGRPQRTRHADRGQASGSSRSFANRVGSHPPDTPTNGNSIASSTLTPRPHNSPPPASQPPPPSPKSIHHPQFPGLLFGEILPGRHDVAAAGFGIDRLRPRRTSDSSVHGLVGRQRSFSDLEAEPASPSSWYRDLHMSRGSASSSKTHARSRSDLSASKPALHFIHTSSATATTPTTTIAALAAATATATAVVAAEAAAPSTSHASTGAGSKLPVSISRRLASPTKSSPASSRSNSPSTFRRPPANGRSSSRQAKANPSSAAATTTTTTATTARAKTPTQTGRKQQAQGLVTPSNSNGRLQAYVSAAPPKLSPPLRSSRPRQPVSVATTASSRMKESAKTKAPARPNARENAAADKDPSSKTYDPAKRKIITVGPIDFEQRREHIRLAYTKTIRESQAFEVRQKAVERRRKQMEEAKTKAAATATASASASASASAATATVTATTTATATAAAAAAASPTTLAAGDQEASNIGSAGGDASPDMVEAGTEAGTETGTGPTENSSTSQLARELAVELPPDHGSRPVEKRETVLENPTDAASHPAPGKGDDSPTLGIPGSFPELLPSANAAKGQRPLSAISVASAVTEFDTEPQAGLSDLTMSDRPLSPQLIVPTRERSQYRSPFEDDDFPSSPPRSPPTTHRTVQDNSAPHSQIDQQLIPEPCYDNEHQEDSFESHAHKHYQAIVKILPQPSREPLAPTEGTARAASFPRLDIQDESDCHSDLESVPAMARRMRAHADDAATDACTDETDDRDGMEDERSPYRFGGHASSNRASTCASSDVETFDDLLYPSHDEQVDAGPPNQLLAPPSISRADRSSHQSAWTNVSVDSMGHSEASESPVLRAASWKLSAGSSGRDDSSLRSFSYSGAGVRPSIDSTRSSIQLGQQLPELDTGEGFSIPYLSTEAASDLSYLSSPRHEPPPLPRSGRNSAVDSQTSSVFYEQSQYGSTLVNSERGSGEYVSHHSETPLSMTDMTSIEAADQYFEGSIEGRPPADSDAKSFIQEADGLSSEERRRLIQRRNVIKELIDTEAVFVRDMNIVEEIYKGTAEACPKLDAKTVKLIFRNSDEIIDFHTSFLVFLKEAVAGIYVPKGGRSLAARDDSFYSEQSQGSIVDLSDARDRETSLGPTFQINMEKMKLAHEGFLRNSDQAAKKLIQIQQDPTVQIWLNECNEVAKDLTAAWDLDSLLIKPMQRITKYPNLIMTLLQHTPQDHPDREALVAAKEALEEAIIEINKTKKNFELVGQIVGRKRKESDVKAGLARAFGKKVDKLQGGTREPEDPEYVKLEERFSDDYLRLQVVLRDVEFYTRQVSSYVHEFLQYLSAIELVMRLQPGSFPELESKWVQFNISIRDIEKVALEQHLAQIRRHVIEPFEHVIKSYGNPSLAMKKRQKRRFVWERAEQLKKAGKSVDPKLKELVEQYEALNDTLIKELPKLSALTEKVGNICLGNLINIQANWYLIWREKMRAVLADAPEMPELEEIVATFQRDFPYANEMMANIGIINPAYHGRTSQSTANGEDALPRTRGRTSEAESRGWGQSLNGEAAPILPAPDFGKRHSGSFTLSPISGGAGAPGLVATAPSPHQYYYRDFYAGLSSSQAGMVSPRSADAPTSSRSLGGTRPSTGKSFDSSAMAMPRHSTESAPHIRRDSGTTFYSSYHQHESRRFSNLFHSALPLPDGPEESQRSSRASSRERAHASDGYNVLWLAASLFEFNISTTKHEAGYPYLTYQAGEIFDVIAEKGELWLAKNQDDPTDQVGWIWSKHFAKLADS